MWWLLGGIIISLFVLIVYERYRFFIEKYDNVLMLANKNKILK